MISIQDAKKLLQNEIDELPFEEAVVIYDEYTIEFDYGWAFFFNLKNLKENEIGLVGHGASLVNKFTSEIIPTGSGVVIEYFIDRYEEKLRGEKNIWTIRLKNKIGFSKYIKHYKLNKRSRWFSKEIWEILNSYPNIIYRGNIKETLRLKDDLEDVGIEIIIEKNGEKFERYLTRSNFL